jgi:DNA polymerase I
MSKPTTLIFDIETNGLLPKVTKLHCIVIHNPDTNETFRYTNTQIDEGLSKLTTADILVGHNISGYDIPAIEQLSDGYTLTKTMHDTLLMSRMFFITTLKDKDYSRLKTGLFPKNLVGKHSLKAWGYRLSQHKGDYADTTDWQTYSPEMLDYCERDVSVTALLYDYLILEAGKQKTQPEAYEIESLSNYWLTQGELNGIGFDQVEAARLYAQLSEQREEASVALKELFKPETVSLGLFTPKRTNARLGYIEGVPVQKQKVVEFNPNSTAHIARRLTNTYGWEPTELTPTGLPKITEAILQPLPFKPVPDLIKYKSSQKLISQLAEGHVNWLKLVRNHKIHGRTMCTGTRTGRMSHSKPNMAQIPSKPEVRKLFKPTRPNWFYHDTDLSGIELRILAHYLAQYDSGYFASVVSEGDPHELFMSWTGIQNRNIQKSFTYALIYGAGTQKLGELVAQDKYYLDNRTPQSINTTLLGQQATETILKELTGYKNLCQAAMAADVKRGEIKLLDTRKVKTAGEHSALNTLIQGSASVVLKHWMCNTYNQLQDASFKDEVKFVAAVHDELLFEVSTEPIGEQLTHLINSSLQTTVKHLKIQCPLSSNSLLGKNWSEVH